MNIRFYNARILVPSEGHSFQVITGELWVKKNEIIYIGDGLDTERVFEKEPAGMILWDREIDAEKNLLLSQRILHTAPKGIRARLLSYFSACVQRTGRYSFDIPYNRQQLADYLSVDRSAMCSELSRMQREGLLNYHKNHFSVHEALE